MGEPTLARPPSSVQRIRLLWLRSFHPGVSKELELQLLTPGIEAQMSRHRSFTSRQG